MAPLPLGSIIAGEEMSVMDWIGLALSLALAVYLFIALLLREKFQ